MDKKNKSTKITREELMDVLRYDENTGEFFRTKRIGRSTKIGDKAGGIDGTGYITISVLGKPYRAHTLAWLYMYGEWPKYIDHKDLDKTNNRISNLREATQVQNSANQKIRKNNTSGYKGVFFDKRSKKWYSQLQYNWKSIYIGSFDSPKEAAEAYAKTASELFGEFFRI